MFMRTLFAWKWSMTWSFVKDKDKRNIYLSVVAQLACETIKFEVDVTAQNKSNVLV